MHGKAPSRAAVVASAIERERRRAVAQRDAAILAQTMSRDDLDELATYAARTGPTRSGLMRPIHLAQLDKERPCCASPGRSPPRSLPRVRPGCADHEHDPRPFDRGTTGYGQRTSSHQCVVSCDNILTVPTSTLGRRIGYLQPAQEVDLAESIRAAFDLI